MIYAWAFIFLCGAASTCFTLWAAVDLYRSAHTKKEMHGALIVNACMFGITLFIWFTFQALKECAHVL